MTFLAKHLRWLCQTAGAAVGGDSAQEGQTCPQRRDAGSAAALPSWQAPQRAFSVARDPTPA
jgi:hypothetical protein